MLAGASSRYVHPPGEVEASRQVSSRALRRLATLLAFAGALIAARLTTYQLGWTGPPWEPLFGDGSVRVLHSSFSRALPFPDAGLGLLAYVVEILTLVWAGVGRWRQDSRPVYAYGATALGMAVGSAGLMVLQAFVIHAFCTLCLTSALLSFALAIVAATEVVATWKRRRSHEPFNRR